MLTLSGTTWSWPSQMSETEVAVERAKLPVWMRVKEIRALNYTGAEGVATVYGPSGYIPHWYEHPLFIGLAAGAFAGFWGGMALDSVLCLRRVNRMATKMGCSPLPPRRHRP